MFVPLKTGDAHCAVSVLCVRSQEPRRSVLRFGVREFSMFAVGNGIAVATFLNFLTTAWARCGWAR